MQMTVCKNGSVDGKDNYKMSHNKCHRNRCVQTEVYLEWPPGLQNSIGTRFGGISGSFCVLFMAVRRTACLVYRYAASGVNGWNTLWDEVQAADRWTDRRRGCQVGPLPSILSIGVGNFLWCGGNQHLPEKRVLENVVSSSIHQGLRRSFSLQRMFRNLQTILSIPSHFCATFWLIFMQCL